MVKFSQRFHQESKKFKLLPESIGEYPKKRSVTYYKTYPRLPKIGLEDDPPAADFFNLVKRRNSRHDFTQTSITKRELSVVLKYSCGDIGRLHDDRHRRAQPSGGAKFPIEVYPIVFRPEEDLKSGLYHYNVKDHKLNVLWDRKFSDEDIGQLFTYPWVKDAAVGLVMTAVFWRNQDKYGERGYRYILLEAGHIGQNIYLISEALGLKCCALGGTKDENLEKLIDIDGVTESVVYAMILGKAELKP